MQEELEKPILDRSGDMAAYSVYADWLTEKGDPRGEFIHVQLRLEEEGLSPSERAQLTGQEEKLLKENQAHWLGALAAPLLEGEDHPWARRNFKFERGFLHTLDCYELTVELLRGLRESDETRFIRKISFDEAEYVETDEEIDGEAITDDTCLLDFLPTDKLQNLQVLRAGGIDDDNTHFNGENAEHRLGELRNLESLELGLLRADSTAIFSLELPKLTRLLLYHVYHYDLEALARNPAMSGLKALGCRPHGLEPDDEGPYIQRSGLEALLNGNFPNLKYLELRASDIGDEGVRMLLDSGWVQRLATLDLHYGEITDAGAKMFAEHPHTKKLKKLDIGGNAITQDGLAALEAAGIRFVSDQQFQLNDDREYLWYGCPE